MSREAFEHSIERARAEVVAIEGILKSHQEQVKETEQALDRAHKVVREKERDLKSYLDAHEGD